MKRFAFAISALALSASFASAADLPMYQKGPLARGATPYSWSGFYIGGNAGGAWGNADPSTSTIFNNTYLAAINVPSVNVAGAAQSNKPNGFSGGFQAGYNWQVSNIVFGLEGDINAFHVTGNSSTTALYAGAPPGGVCPASCFTLNSSVSTDWLGTLRARLGLAADNWLFYGTGGAAFTTLKGSFAFSDPTPANETASFSNSKTGYAAGGGVEYGLSRNWTLKAEYLYVNFGTVTAAGTIAQFPTQPLFHSIDLKANILRVGFNYKL